MWRNKQSNVFHSARLFTFFKDVQRQLRQAKQSVISGLQSHLTRRNPLTDLQNWRTHHHRVLPQDLKVAYIIHLFKNKGEKSSMISPHPERYGYTRRAGRGGGAMGAFAPPPPPRAEKVRLERAKDERKERQR